MNLQEQLSQWINDGNYEQIIETVGNIPESELDMFTLCQLALAYNNTNRLQESIDLLMNVWDVGEEHPVWNYYLGYALVFSGRKEEAREYLLRARELSPEIPAEKILHFCICHDGEDDKPIDNNALVGWVCEMVGGEQDGSTVRLPELGMSITPWFDDLNTEGPCAASLYFQIILKEDTSFFECCVGLGETPRDAVNSALGSFYLGIYSALQKLCRKEKLLEIEDAKGRAWSVYIGEIVGMGNHPLVPLESYWELLEHAIPDYLGSQSPVYVKLYGARNGENITAECRVNDTVSQSLSALLYNPVSEWGKEKFASHKQFFFLMCEEEMQPYPYSQEQISSYVQQTVSLFCNPEIKYDDIFSILAGQLGDPHLASELHAFIPELCAEKAFENITCGDHIHISAGDKTMKCTKWQVTALRMIDIALSQGFQNKLYPENAFRDCTAASSIWNVVCKAKEDGHDLLQTGGTIQCYYNFHDEYILR